MSDLPRRNGWTLAERPGDRTPDRMQRLLSRAVWDAAAVIRAVRRFAVAGLDQAARDGGRRGLVVGAIDETSQVKQGERTAGVKRHYLGCAGKVANGITTVHLAYAREGIGHALIAARQWIPREHLEDPRRGGSCGCRRAWPSGPRGSWPSTCSPKCSPTASAWTSHAGTRSTAAAPSCGSTWKPAAWLTYAGPVERLPHHGPRRQAHLQAGRRHAGGRRAWLGDPPGRDRRQGPALVRLGLAGHRLPAALPAHPPPADHRRPGHSLHLLSDPDARFHDLGPGYYADRIDPERRKRNHIRQLEALGYTVTLKPAA